MKKCNYMGRILLDPSEKQQEYRDAEASIMARERNRKTPFQAEVTKTSMCDRMQVVWEARRNRRVMA